MKDCERKVLILDELEYEPSVAAEDIGVVVDSGVVTLYGHVRSFVERMAAETAAKRVKGVRAVANEIVVRLPGDPPGDDDIARRAAQIFAWDPFLNSEAVTVRVQAGHVDIDGEVRHRYQKARATRLLERLEGVVGLHNHVEVKSKATKTDIKERIEAALQRYAHHDARSVHVVVADGKVFLSGKVRNLAERELVDDTAWSAPGVTEVVNALQVQ